MCPRLPLLLALLLVSVSACGRSKYQQIANPHPECGPLPEPGCGIAILDTQTGTIYVRDSLGWWEEQPQSGKITRHKLDYELGGK